VEYGTPQSIASSAGTVVLNDLDNGAGLMLDPGNGYLVSHVDGNEGATLRTPSENRPRAGGGLLHPFFKSFKLIIIEGRVVVTVPENRTILDDYLRGVTDIMLREDGIYTWSLPPYPYSTTRFHTVRLNAPVTILGQSTDSGMNAEPKTFHIELLAYKTDTEVY
jgi:hypothetical protein